MMTKYLRKWGNINNKWGDNNDWHFDIADIGDGKKKRASRLYKSLKQELGRKVNLESKFGEEEFKTLSKHKKKLRGAIKQTIGTYTRNSKWLRITIARILNKMECDGELPNEWPRGIIAFI